MSVLLTFLCLPSRATSIPLIPEHSLEWEVELADLVVRGTVHPGGQRHGNGQGARSREVTLDVSETIKGQPLERVTFVTPPNEQLDLPDDSWSDVLVFMIWQDDAVRPNVGSARLGQWVSVRGLAIVLGPRVRPVQRMDGSWLSGGEELLRAVREAATFAKTRGQPCGEGRFRKDPFGRELIVPKDARLQALAERLLADPDVARRTSAVELLGQMRTPANLERLRQLLKDPVFDVGEGVEWTPKLEERAWKVYPVRREAVWTLGTQRLSDCIEPHMRYAAVQWRGWAVGLAAMVGVAVLWPSRWGPGGWGGRLAFIFMGLVGVLVVVWWRSGRAGETYSFAAGGADYEVVSVTGHLGMLRVQDSAPPHALMVRQFDRQQYGDGFWFAPLLKPAQEVAWRRLYLAEGQTVGSGKYSYRLLTLPYWALMVAMGLWPAAWGMQRVRHARRRRRWLRGNRCGRCGYDLRGHTGEGRCPECGEENAAALRGVGIAIAPRV